MLKRIDTVRERTMELFNASRMRIARAREHFDDLDKRLNEFLDRKPYTVVAEHNPTTHEYTVRAQIRESPDPKIAILTGEVVQHLRSALDYAVGELIAIGTQRTPDPDFDFEFPIVADPGKRREVKRKTHGIPRQIVALIHALQPYNTSNPQKNCLWLLHRINIEDKHRALHVVGGGSALRHIKHTGEGGPDAFRFSTKWIDNSVTFPIEDGAPVFSYFAAPQYKGDVEITITPFIGFASPQEVYGFDVRSLLNLMIENTEGILDQLAAHVTNRI